MIQSLYRSRRAVHGFLTVSTMALAGAAMAILGVAGPSAAMLAPEPAPVPKRWQLDIETSPLRIAMVDTPGVGPRPYFYLTYKVINNSKTDLLFAPSFELATDEMDVLRSGRDVPVAVTNELLQRLQNPFLEDQISVVGTIFRGPENAKEGLVVWPVPAMHLSQVSVYGAGFSGETTTLELPNPETGKPEKKLLRKTYEADYRLPGDLAGEDSAEILPFSTGWIMR